MNVIPGGKPSVPSPLQAEVGAQIMSRYDGRHLVLEVAGEVDAENSDRLLADLMAALDCDPASVAVDLSGLGFCDLAGLDALNGFVAGAAARGTPVELRDMSALLSWMYDRFPAATT